MTLNLAHGRRDGFHQALQRRARIEANLAAVAVQIARVDPDLVALQEADGPSLWSGRFDHVRYLAEAAHLPYHLRGEHVKWLSLSYGTALLSRLPLSDAASTRFAPSPPTPSKGFVIGAVGWPGHPDLVVDVVSLHLDFARKRVREAQVGQLAEALAQRGRPAIVMGDFNCEWTARGSAVRKLAEARDLHAWEPEAPGLATFPSRGTRLDWVLASRDLEFAEYWTVPEPLADHRGVVAGLRLARRA